MLEREFELFLITDEGISSKNKAVATRLSKARAVERELNTSLDSIVSNDISMYRALLEINKLMKNNNGAYSNALRKYYTFKNSGLIFPHLTTFEFEHRNEL